MNIEITKSSAQTHSLNSVKHEKNMKYEVNESMHERKESPKMKLKEKRSGNPS